jgi:hypothetical protein
MHASPMDDWSKEVERDALFPGIEHPMRFKGSWLRTGFVQ